MEVVDIDHRAEDLREDCFEVHVCPLLRAGRSGSDRCVQVEAYKDDDVPEGLWRRALLIRPVTPIGGPAYFSRAMSYQANRREQGLTRQKPRTRRSPLRLLLLSVLAAACARPAVAESVALTFDDVPVFGRRASIGDTTSVTTDLLGGLRRHHFVATGFVNEVQLEGPDRPARIALLARWLDAGMDLGNHTFSHLSLTKTPVDAYIADTAHGELVTASLLRDRGRKMRWFRHPYLETGATTESREKFDRWLQIHGYRIAPVTMENSDWLFALPYDDAISRKDYREADRIRQAYLEYTTAIVAWYREAAFELLGRRPAFVFLLHASRLNAASIDSLATILRAQDLHVVSLERATQDVAYQIADTYVGPDGQGWLTRWATTLRKTLPWGNLPHVPEEIAIASARLANPAVALGAPAR